MASFFKSLFGKSHKGAKHVLLSLQQKNLKKFDDCLKSEGFDINKATAEYNSETKDPWTLLMRISYEFDSKFLLYLLDFKPDINQCSEKEGQTPLMLAVINGRVDNVRNLCIFNCDKNIIDKTYDGFSALHYACKYGSVDIVTVLIGNIGMKANIEIRSKFNKTPLQVARSYNHKEVCSLLQEQLQHGTPVPGVSSTSPQSTTTLMKPQPPVATENWDSFDSNAACAKGKRSNKKHSQLKGQPDTNSGAKKSVNSTGSEQSPGVLQGAAVQQQSTTAVMPSQVPYSQQFLSVALPPQPYNRDSGCYASSKEAVHNSSIDQQKVMHQQLFSMRDNPPALPLRGMQKAYSVHELNRDLPMSMSMIPGFIPDPTRLSRGSQQNNNF